jgi:hypothetical protein
MGTPTAAPNLIERVLMVFMSPTKLGESLRSQSPWVWALAIVAVVSTVVLLLLPSDLLLAAMEQRAAGRSQGQQAPDPEQMLLIGRISGAAGALLGTFIFAAIMAGIIYLVFNVMLGGETTYKQHLSATAHMYWINTLGFLLTAVIWIQKGSMEAKLGLGLILPDAPESFVEHFMNNITIFGLWSSVALGAIESGLSGGRVSVGKAAATIIVLYLIWAAGSGALAAIFGGM